MAWSCLRLWLQKECSVVAEWSLELFHLQKLVTLCKGYSSAFKLNSPTSFIGTILVFLLRISRISPTHCSSNSRSSRSTLLCGVYTEASLRAELFRSTEQCSSSAGLTAPVTMQDVVRFRPMYTLV